MRPLHAVVAVLDALGAADYSRDQVDQFLETRSWLLVELPRLLKQFLLATMRADSAASRSTTPSSSPI
jgi:hypothetical protein